MALEEWATKVKHQDSRERRWFLEFLEEDAADVIRAIAPDLTPQERLFCLRKYPKVQDFEGYAVARAAQTTLQQMQELVRRTRWEDYSVPDLAQQMVVLYHATSPEYQTEVLRYLCNESLSLIAMSASASLEPTLEPARWELVRELLHENTRHSGMSAVVPRSASPRLRVALLHHELLSPHLHVVMNAIVNHKVDPLKHPEGLPDTLLDGLRTLKTLWACGRCP